MGKGAIACMLAACLATLLMTAPAFAQVEQELDFCTGKNHPTPAQQIAGCVAVLKSGRWSKKASAFAYDNMGRALVAQGDIDRAITAYGEALGNDPDYALSYRKSWTGLCLQERSRSCARRFHRSDQSQCDFGACLQRPGLGLSSKRRSRPCTRRL